MSHSVYKNPPRRSPGHRYYRYRNLQFATFVLILIKLIWILSIRRTAGLADRRMTAPQWTCQRGVLTLTFAALPPFPTSQGYIISTSSYQLFLGVFSFTLKRDHTLSLDVDLCCR